jgi:hypothetical protein
MTIAALIVLAVIVLYGVVTMTWLWWTTPAEWFENGPL